MVDGTNIREISLTDREFSLFQKLIYEKAGINMTSAKKALISGRLAKRVKHHALTSYGDYYKLLVEPNSHELQVAIDLLTTNETYFFREPRHFDYLRDHVIPTWSVAQPRIWSAACSSGEESYTLAMIMASHFRSNQWKIVATDLSTHVLEKARKGVYPIERSKNIPREYLVGYCRKGIGDKSGTFIVVPQLRKNIVFEQYNLINDSKKYEPFDLIMLRNVLIYFDVETKSRVIQKLIEQLKPGGYLMVGHSESLNGIDAGLNQLASAIYQKI